MCYLTFLAIIGKISFLKKNLAGSFEDTELPRFKFLRPQFSPKFSKILEIPKILLQITKISSKNIKSPQPVLRVAMPAPARRQVGLLVEASVF